MTPRQLRLVRHGVAAALLVVFVGASVWWTERARDEDDADDGIVDVLARDMPADLPDVRFIDATAAAGIRFRHFPGVRSRQLPEDMGSGVAWGDCDGDGRPDLYAVDFVGPLGMTEAERRSFAGNALYRNRGDGTFEDVSAAAGVDLKGFGIGAAWADYDGDGDEDLYVTQYGGNVLFENAGDCTFTDVTERAGVGAGGFSAGASWGDHDGDGDLDLYVTRYVVYEVPEGAATTASQQYGRSVPYTLNPASFEPATNLLYRNEGGGRFVDVAAEAGVENATGRSLSAIWCDFDGDLDLDLYVANDISDNAFYRNRGDGTFEDVSTRTLTADYRGAMGLAVADFDRDLDLDFFVTHWIAQENALYESYVRGSGGSDQLLFTDVADLVGLGATALDRVGWATEFVDWDNDGRKDLFVVNGHTFEDEADPTRLLPQRMQLFWNRGEEGFYDVSAAAGPPFERLIVGRGGAAADYDADGDVDLAVQVHSGQLLLLSNEGSSDNHWVEIDLAGPAGNPRGIGAWITIEAGGARSLHAVGSTPSYLSQGPATAHFGLGAAETVERVTVRWPDGVEEAWTDLAADRVHTLVRGEGGR